MSSPDAPPSMASRKSCMGRKPTDRCADGVEKPVRRLPPCGSRHKVDYGVRAARGAGPGEAETRPACPSSGRPWPRSEGIPGKFLDDILRLLRNSGIVRSHRGPEGGWTLGRPAAEITVADVIRVLEGPLASVRGCAPTSSPDDGVDEPMVSLWVAVRVSLRSVLERGHASPTWPRATLPKKVAKLLDDPGGLGQAD